MSKGKQPRTRVNKVPKLMLSEINVVYILNDQEIGLEAAIFWRSRNRALVLFYRYKHWKFNGSKQYTDTLSIYIYTIVYRVAERWVNL